MKKTYEFGNLAERIAIIFLFLKGYKILAKRYKTKLGEIDIIAKKNKKIIFIEVKARKNNELLETILHKKQIERIKNAAQIFIAKNKKYQNFDWRFDFILFKENLFPKHLKNYF